MITIAVIGVIGYWIYTRNKAKKSLNPFAKSSNFTANENGYMDEAIAD